MGHWPDDSFTAAAKRLGKGVIPKLAVDLKNELAEVKGFSVRNIQMMVQFFNEYRELISIGKLSVAELENDTNTQLPVAHLDDTAITQLRVAQLEITKQQLITKIGRAHHIILNQKLNRTSQLI